MFLLRRHFLMSVLTACFVLFLSGGIALAQDENGPEAPPAQDAGAAPAPQTGPVANVRWHTGEKFLYFTTATMPSGVRWFQIDLSKSPINMQNLLTIKQNKWKATVVYSGSGPIRNVISLDIL